MSDPENPSEGVDEAELGASVGEGVTAAPEPSGLVATTERPEVDPETAAALEAQRDEEDRELRGIYGGWLYLAFLFVVFLALALVAYGCNDSSGTEDSSATTESTLAASADAAPVSLDLTVTEDGVTVSGSVPDEGAQRQILDAAEGIYGEGHVVNQLTLDEETTIDGGTFALSGETTAGDERPVQLAAAIAAIGLSEDDSSVSYIERELQPVDIEAAVSTSGVVLSGVMPDQPSLDSLVAGAGTVWGPENVDSSGLEVGEDYTLEGGTVRITGSVDAGDTRPATLAAGLSELGATVENQVEFDESAEALGRLEEELREQLRANPINFELGSAEIASDSDAILEQAAAAISAAPGIEVEIVGHTDSTGDPAANQTLSQERAVAVRDRLVELGVSADRLEARGAGADEPIASNDTEEGRAENRRIEFEFAGAATSE